MPFKHWKFYAYVYIDVYTCNLCAYMRVSVHVGAAA